MPGYQVRQGARHVWLNIGAALLVLVLLEGAARAGFAVIDRGRRADRLVGYEQLYDPDAATDQGWITEYLRELRDANRADWHSYVYWRSRPYRGTYLSIDEAGIRRTWNSASSPSPGQLKIFMFGGSTLWGYGARDEFTIPSLVAKKLTTRLDTGVWVTNFAENGYVSTQEVIALMLELRKGNVPGVVAFFDGVNDTFAAFQSGVAGIPQNESNRVAEFDLLQRLSWRQAVIERLALYRLSQGAVRSLGLSRSARPAPTNAGSPDALARAVVDVYFQNVSLVETLAQRFGFRAVFFWQPTVLTKRYMSQRERQWYEQPGRRFVRAAPFFGQVHAAFGERLSTSKAGDVQDLSGVFDEFRGAVFIDEFHVSEAGNEKIAEIMARTLQKVAQDRPR